MSSKSTILVVEDCDEDFETLGRVIKKNKLNSPVIRCYDGDEALDLLYHRHPYTDQTDADRPSLILLDLNLPGTDGRAVLEQIKGDERLKTIPVIILTSSASPSDIQECYRSGANSYLLKHQHMEKFNAAIQQLNDYWFKTVVLPD